MSRARIGKNAMCAFGAIKTSPEIATDAVSSRSIPRCGTLDQSNDSPHTTERCRQVESRRYALRKPCTSLTRRKANNLANAAVAFLQSRNLAGRCGVKTGLKRGHIFFWLARRFATKRGGGVLCADRHMLYARRSFSPRRISGERTLRRFVQPKRLDRS